MHLDDIYLYPIGICKVNHHHQQNFYAVEIIKIMEVAKNAVHAEDLEEFEEGDEKLINSEFLYSSEKFNTTEHEGERDNNNDALQFSKDDSQDYAFDNPQQMESRKKNETRSNKKKEINDMSDDNDDELMILNKSNEFSKKRKEISIGCSSEGTKPNDDDIET